MKRVLFVSRDYNARNDGGSAVAKRNLAFLKALGLQVAELTIGVPSLAVRLKNVLLRESYGDRRSLRKQLKYHLSQPYDFVFFDGSHYGVYLREFARHGFKTICFFHNVEVDYYQQKYKTTHQPQDKLMVGFIAHNERCCIDHASYLITLNERDNQQLQKRYHRGADFILPTSFDAYDAAEHHDPVKLPEQYLLFEHDEFTMKPVLDETGRLIPREDYRLSTLNCDGEDFAVACMRANLRYGKNQRREDVKSHHYIISFDPRDGTDNGLTVDRAQELGEQFCKEHFPGHQALICTHPDGHNHSGNIHVHIVINSLRIYEVPLLPYMDRPADTREGCKHRCTDAAMEYFKSEVMEMCHRENLYQIDLLHGSKNRVTEREYWAQKKGQLALDKANAPMIVQSGQLHVTHINDIF